MTDSSRRDFLRTLCIATAAALHGDMPILLIVMLPWVVILWGSRQVIPFVGVAITRLDGCPPGIFNHC